GARGARRAEPGHAPVDGERGARAARVLRHPGHGEAAAPRRRGADRARAADADHAARGCAGVPPRRAALRESHRAARRSAGETARLYAVSTLFAQDARYHLSLRILRREFLPLARAGYPWLPRLF